MNRISKMGLLLIVLLTSVLITGCSQNTLNKNIKEVKKPETEMEKVMKSVGLSDLLWLSIEKDGPEEGIYHDALVVKAGNEKLITKFIAAIQNGRLEKVSIKPKSITKGKNKMKNKTKSILLGMKLGNGKYIETEYKDKGFYLSTKDIEGDKAVLVKPTQEFDNLVQQITTRKFSVSDQIEKDKGQIRNNHLILVRNSIYKWFNDPVFKNFQGSDMNTKEYEQFLINEGKKKGIDHSKLIKALKSAKKPKNEYATLYPVIIDTAYHKNRECIVIVYTWESNGLIHSKGKVKSLGHVYVVVIDINSNKKVIEGSCA